MATRKTQQVLQITAFLMDLLENNIYQPIEKLYKLLLITA